MKKLLLNLTSSICFALLGVYAFSQCTVSTPTITVNGNQISYTATGTGATAPIYVWNFGDGSNPTAGQTGTYTYAGPGTYNVCVIYADSLNPFACAVQQCTTINIIGTLIEELNPQAFEAFPNPAHNELYIQSTNRIEAIEIIDITGKIIFKEDYNVNVVRIDLSTLTSGFYFTRVRINGTIHTQKIQKQ
jgi:hypothetical protein